MEKSDKFTRKSSCWLFRWRRHKDDNCYFEKSRDLKSYFMIKIFLTRKFPHFHHKPCISPRLETVFKSCCERMLKVWFEVAISDRHPLQLEWWTLGVCRWQIWSVDVQDATFRTTRHFVFIFIFYFLPTLALCDSCTSCIIHQVRKYPVQVYIMYNPSSQKVPCTGVHHV